MDQDVTGQHTSYSQEEGVPAQAAETHRPLEGDNMPVESEPGMEALLRDTDYAFRSVRRGETTEGTVVRVDQDEVLVDIGLKSEGIIPSRELFSEDEENRPLYVGEHVLVYVMQPEDSEGHAVLSLRRARMERSWREIEEMYHRGQIVEGPVVDFNKGGLIVDVKGIRGFVPVSQVLDLRNVSRQEGESEEVSQTLAAMNGRRLPLKIIEINRSRNRLILSERAAVQERRSQLKDELMDELEAGQVRQGVVSNLTSFGAFVDLGGADGLVHVSELSYNRVNHPSEVLRVGQKVDVFVLSVDKDTRKIALSLKRALPDPWTTVDEQYRVGQVVPAVITKLAKFGAFAKVQEGLEGLIHLSELTDQPVQDAAQVVAEGQQVDVKIIHINSQRRRLGLSVRQAVEPQTQVQSFGEDDLQTSFSGYDFTPYTTSAEQAPALQPTQEEYSPQNSPSHESELFTGEQDKLAAESEPEAYAPRVNGSGIVASEEVSPTSTDATSEHDEPDRDHVASVSSQRSMSE